MLKVECSYDMDEYFTTMHDLKQLYLMGNFVKQSRHQRSLSIVLAKLIQDLSLYVR
jgi:hypothetical protein